MRAHPIFFLQTVHIKWHWHRRNNELRMELKKRLQTILHGEQNCVLNWKLVIHWNNESGHCECPNFYCKWSFFFGKSMGFVSLKLFPLNCMPNDEILFRRGTKINGLYAVVDESVVLVHVLNNSMPIEQLTCALFPHFQILNFYESSSLRFSYARQMYWLCEVICCFL